MDYFASLPPEIIQLIWNNLEPGNGGLGPPISKALLSFQQRRLFRRIRISQWNRLEQVCEASQHQSGPLQYTECLEVRLRDRWGSPTADEWKPTKSALVRFFASLVQIKVLDLSGLQQATPVLLDPLFAATSLPNLASLTLSSSRTDLDDPFDPFDPLNFAAIAHYTNLDSFALLDTRSSNRIVSSPNSSSTLDLSRSKVRQLSLSGFPTTCEASAKRLLASFIHLERLSLQDDTKASRLYDLLDGVKNRRGLKELRLVQSHYDEDYFDEDNLPSGPAGDLGLTLPRFPSLSSLTLGNLCDVTSPSLYDALRKLSLDHLAFEKGSELSLAHLTRLVDGGGMNHRLKTIKFDNVEGERGTRIQDVGRPYDDDEIDAWNVYPDWVLPKWNEDFEEADLVQLMEIAKREGIEVIGTAVEGIGINREFELEHEKLEEYNYRREVITGW